jgi:hypothetical protein
MNSLGQPAIRLATHKARRLLTIRRLNFWMGFFNVGLQIILAIERLVAIDANYGF